MIPNRRCRKEDYDLFAPIIENEKAQLKQYRDGDKDLLCLDWDQVGGELEIFGNFDVETEYQTFEYLVVPCNYVHAELGPTNDTIPDGCIADREKQMEYLGNMQIVVLTDDEFFEQQNFDVTVQKRSRFYKKQADSTKSSWIDFKFRENEIEDETKLL